MKSKLTRINLEATLPRDPDTVLNIIVNSFAARLPWGGALPRIVERRRDGFVFSVESFTPFNFFADSGRVLVSADGRKSRVGLQLEMQGSLLALYATHLLLVLLLTAVHFTLVPLVASSQGAALAAALFFVCLWPLVLFVGLRVQQRRKLRTFLANLIYFV